MSMARITNPAWICLVLNSERISLSLNPRWIFFVWILNSEWMYPLSGFSGVSCSSYLLAVQCSLAIGCRISEPSLHPKFARGSLVTLAATWSPYNWSKSPLFPLQFAFISISFHLFAAKRQS